MNISERLSSALGDNSQLPNKELAREIVTSQDRSAVQELRAILRTDQKLDAIGDTLKVLEMIGELDSRLAKKSFQEITRYLEHKNNKIQWRAMSALSNIAVHHLEKVYSMIPSILQIMEKGTVITRDHGVKIMLSLYENQDYRETIGALLNEQVMEAPDNQLGQYAERWSKIIDSKDLGVLIRSLETRQPDLQNPSHQKRIARILKKLYKRTNNQ